MPSHHMASSSAKLSWRTSGRPDPARVDSVEAGAPTDPDVRISRIRLFSSWVRCAKCGMDCACRGQREVFQQLIEAPPGHRLLGPSTEPLFPRLVHLVRETTEGSRVTGDAEVPVMPSEDRAEVSLLLREGAVPESPAPVPYPFE